MSPQNSSAGALRSRSELSEVDRQAVLPEPASSGPSLSESYPPSLNSNANSSETDVLDSELYKPDSQAEIEIEKDYRQYLYRLFGKETADYFLIPSHVHTDISDWYDQVIELMGDKVSAVALWEALREQSTLTELEESSLCCSKVLKACGDAECQNKRRRLRRLAGVKKMFHLAQLRQVSSAQLLALKPLFLNKGIIVNTPKAEPHADSLDI